MRSVRNTIRISRLFLAISRVANAQEGGELKPRKAWTAFFFQRTGDLQRGLAEPFSALQYSSNNDKRGIRGEILVGIEGLDRPGVLWREDVLTGFMACAMILPKVS